MFIEQHHIYKHANKTAEFNYVFIKSKFMSDIKDKTILSSKHINCNTRLKNRNKFKKV